MHQLALIVIYLIDKTQTTQTIYRWVVFRLCSAIKTFVYGVGLVAHSCGVTEPRGLTHQHVRVIGDGGFFVPTEALFPTPPQILNTLA